MMLELPIALFSIMLGYFLPGFLSSFLFFKERELTHLERLSVSIMLSIAIIGALMTFLGLTIGFNATTTTAFLLILSSISYLLASSEISAYLHRALYSPDMPRFSPAERLIFFIVLLQLSFAFYYSIFFPVDGGDALSTHAPLAKLYAEAGSLVPAEGFLEFYNPVSHGFHLFISWFYLLNGFNDLFARLVPPMLFLASSFLVYSFSKRLFDERTAWIALLFFVSTPLVIAHAQVLYLNLPEMAFALAGTFALFLALKSDRPHAYLAAGFLGGFAALIKPSGIISFAALAILLMVYLKRTRAPVPLIFISAGALASAAPLWFLSNSQAYLDPSYYFYAFGPKVLEPITRYPFFPIFDSMIAVNQGFGPFLFSFGLAGAYLLFRRPVDAHKRFEESFSLAWLVALIILSELFLLNLGARFAILLAPVSSLFAAYGFARLSSDRKAHVRILSVLLLILMIVPSFALGVIGFKSARISYETNTLVFNTYIPPPSHEQFLRDSYGPIMEGIEYINQETPQGSKVLTNIPLTYLFDRTIYDTGMLGNRSDFYSTIAYLENKGVSYIFIAQADIAYDPHADNPIQANTDHWRLQKLYANERVMILKIK